jgi:hypothetical protein
MSEDAYEKALVDKAVDPQYYNQVSDPVSSQDAVMLQARAVDAQHEAMQLMVKQIEDLQAQLNAAQPVSEKTSKKLNAAGGEPIPHHLHLVDGRVIPNHPGIGTHYSEVVNGKSVVTRIKEHYPANEVDPASLFV